MPHIQDNRVIDACSAHQTAALPAAAKDLNAWLHKAVVFGFTHEVKLAIANGAAPDAENGTCVLHCLEKYKWDILEILIDAGSQVDQHDGIIFNRLCEAQQWELLKKCLNLNKNKTLALLNSALILTAKKGQIEPLKMLLAHGLDVHCRSNSVLKWASVNSHCNVVQFLLENYTYLPTTIEFIRSLEKPAINDLIDSLKERRALSSEFKTKKISIKKTKI